MGGWSFEGVILASDLSCGSLVTWVAGRGSESTFTKAGLLDDCAW